MKCPKCHFDNPSDSKFCKGCGTQLLAAEEVSVTKTLETPVEELTRGTTFAGRYEIIEELGELTKAIDHCKKFLDLWKDADLGIPEVEDARKRLAGLRSQ